MERRVRQSEVLAYIKRRPATAKEVEIDLGLSRGGALNRLKRLTDKNLVNKTGFPAIFYVGGAMNIEPTENKAEHTVAMRHLLPIIEQKMRDKKWGDARVMLADLRVHAWELIKYLDKRIVEER